MQTLLIIALTVSHALAIQTDRTIEELDIREATFRYQFQKNASGLQQNAGVYCLSIVLASKETDPDDAFMKRFSSNTPPAKKASACTRNAGGVVDGTTLKRGLLFRTEGIRWASETSVEVEGGYYEGGLSASGNTYYLKKIDGQWKVQSDVMHWIA